MKILFPHIPPSTTSEALADLVTRFTAGRSRATDTKKTRIKSAQVIKFRDPEGSPNYFGLVEPVSEAEGLLFLVAADKIGQRAGFLVARKFEERGPKNPFFTAENDWRRSDLTIDDTAEGAREDTFIH